MQEQAHREVVAGADIADLKIQGFGQELHCNAASAWTTESSRLVILEKYLVNQRRLALSV